MDGSSGLLRPIDLSTFATFAACASFLCGFAFSRSRVQNQLRQPGGVRGGHDWGSWTRTASLWFGAAAGVLIVYLLAVRLIHVTSEMIWSVPQNRANRFASDVRVSLSLALLLVVQIVVWFRTRDRRLTLSLFWTTVAGVSWVFLLEPALVGTSAGGYRRTNMTLNLLSGLAVLLLCWAILAVIRDRDRGLMAAMGALRRAADASHDEYPPQSPLGKGGSSAAALSTSVGVLALCLSVPVWFHLLAPVGELGSSAASVGRATVVAGMVAVGCHVLLMRTWSEWLADALCGMAAQAVCGVCILAAIAWATLVGSGRIGSWTLAGTVGERFPILFAAIMAGLAFSSAWFTWLARIWRPQLLDGRAWTTEGRLIPTLGRFSFLHVALALVLGAVLTFWPQQPAVASSDDALGQVIAGLAAHLFVVVVTLRAARQWRRVTFRILSVVAMGSTAMFLIVRIWPFRSHVS